MIRVRLILLSIFIFHIPASASNCHAFLNSLESSFVHYFHTKNLLTISKFTEDLKNVKDELEVSTTKYEEKEEEIRGMNEKAEKQQVEFDLLTTQLSTLLLIKDDLELKIRDENELKEKGIKDQAEIELKKKEEREKNDKDSRNFYAIRLHKIQTAHEDQTDKMMADMTALENQIKDLTSQKNSELASKSVFDESNSKSAIATLETRIHEMTKVIEESRGELDEFYNTVINLNSELNTIKDEKNILQTQKNVLQHENDVIKNRIELLQVEVDSSNKMKNETATNSFDDHVTSQETEKVISYYRYFYFYFILILEL